MLLNEIGLSLSHAVAAYMLHVVSISIKFIINGQRGAATHYFRPACVDHVHPGPYGCNLASSISPKTYCGAVSAPLHMEEEFADSCELLIFTDDGREIESESGFHVLSEVLSHMRRGYWTLTPRWHV